MSNNYEPQEDRPADLPKSVRRHFPERGYGHHEAMDDQDTYYALGYPDYQHMPASSTSLAKSCLVKLILLAIIGLGIYGIFRIFS